MQRICRGYVADMQRLCRGYVEVMQRFCRGYVEVMQRLCRGYLEVMQRICRGYVEVMQRICRRYVEVISRLCRRYVATFCEIDRDLGTDFIIQNYLILYLIQTTFDAFAAYDIYENIEGNREIASLYSCVFNTVSKFYHQSCYSRRLFKWGAS